MQNIKLQHNNVTFNKVKQQNTFTYEMLSVILSNKISKNKIVIKTGISLSTIRRIMRNEKTFLNYGQFKRLLYMYCYYNEFTLSNS